MSIPHLDQVAQAVVSRARQQGYVVPSEVREQLTQAGLSDENWKEVVERAGSSLSCRHGRYYFVPPAVARLRERSRQDQNVQQVLRKAVRHVIQQYRRAAVETERRAHDRIQILQSVKVVTAEGDRLNLLCRDLSLTGMSLLGTRDLLGQKVRVLIPPTDEADECCFLVHILWTNLVADGLYESGGIFLELVPDGGGLKVVGTER